MEGGLLSGIDSPADLKVLSYAQLDRLAAEIRRLIIRTVATNGGHLASNLGVIELTLALHRAFDSPRDKIIWDVGHQCYTHKIITGRRDRFATLRTAGGLSGFPKRSESEHDAMNTGHASTSLSAALGILIGQELRGDRSGKVIAVIGDGALSGGMALEALSHAGQVGKNLIVVLNDNKMSISPNVGAISRYLSRLATTAVYQNFRKRVDFAILSVPLVGRRLYAFVYRFKRGLKALFFKENLFSDLGYEYVGPIDGHNIPKLVQVFKDVRSLEKPVVVHVITRKGKGYRLAESDPTQFHGISPFSIVDGKIDLIPRKSYTEVFSNAMLILGAADKRVVAVSAAMAKNTGLAPFQERFPSRFFDVGIAEEHAVTFSAGLAAAGLRPVTAIYSTFLQRSVDQVIHDVALQDLPVVLAADRAGLVSDDGETHQGIYDIALFRSVPNLTILAPGSGCELQAMLEWAVVRGKPALIRYPKGDCPKELAAYSLPIREGEGVFLKRAGASVLVVAVGGLCAEAVEAADRSADDGIAVDVFNLRFVKPLNEKRLLKACAGYRTVIVVEDGASCGGIGEKIAALLREDAPGRRCVPIGVPDVVLSQDTRGALLDRCGLSAARIAERIAALETELRPRYVLRASAPER